MTKEARAARNAYYREWRKKNPDKVRIYEASKWENVAKRQGEAKKNAES